MRIKVATRKFLTPFILGVMVKEVVLFIKEHGLSDQYPLARALFIIIFCSILLMWLWQTEEIEALEESIKCVNQLATKAQERINDLINRLENTD